MKNIFENAYFGKQYKTRDGRKAIYIGGHRCVIENKNNCFFSFRSNGMYEGYATGTDIISEWQEEINEKELEELADEYATEIDYEYMVAHPRDDWSKKFVEYHWQDLAKAFKAGYRKAKEE